MLGISIEQGADTCLTQKVAFTAHTAPCHVLHTGQFSGLVIRFLYAHLQPRG